MVKFGVFLTAFIFLFSVNSIAQYVFEEVSLESLGRNYEKGTNVTEYQSESNKSGNTSIRNYNTKSLEWKTQGYYQRNRDIGQVFVPQRDMHIKSIVMRTGPTEKAVLFNTPGAEVFMQFFEVIGDPVINDNGTPQGTESTHGFNTNHRTDDFIESVTYDSFDTIYKGKFPENIPATMDKNGIPQSDEGRLHYIRWIFKNPISVEAGKRYAFMIGFSGAAPGHRFTVGNNNKAAAGAPPSLNDEHTPYKGGWSIRREGNGLVPPTMIPGDDPPADQATRQQLKNESLFKKGDDRFDLSPTSEGYPDVDTYRALEFYIEEDVN
ncbi:MAG: hypothetical protein K9J30_14320 [Bacteroidales bacterium]|nr:hypothetical protein [Bacteroidales bacterium]